jgi:2-polyprenyl-3-methyl-5-hydroxy-6-metoxy-1,4-benzoquinol methylase
MSNDAQSEGEPQYREMIEEIRRRGRQELGYMTSWAYLDDPKRLTFMMARYKFVAKMLDGASSVLEVGCGDGFGTRIVAQSTRNITAIDFDPEFIEDARSLAVDKFPIEFRQHDMLRSSVEGTFDAAYSLDVLEHIEVSDEDKFITNIAGSLKEDGVVIIGTPSLESQAYASRMSKLGHVNCKTQADLKVCMKRHFANVFMFGMNDEVVHTGYGKMVHYHLALCVRPLRDACAG